ncbi:MAG TPA: MarP family serine protease [Rugosimonospora sp.]|nr:MarP family serine protease [Rugosimonospora sp.]
MYGSLVDVVLVILIVIFAVNGYRQGFVIGLLSFVGFFGGAALGLQLGPWLANFAQTPAPRVFISLATIFLVAIAGQALAGWLGAKIRATIRTDTARTLDDLGGAVVSGMAVLMVAWLVAAPLGASSLPGLARAVKTSALLHGINVVMPSQVKALSDALRQSVNTDGFPSVFGDLDPTHVRQVQPPDGQLAGAAVVTRAHSSVVKILGNAPSCGKRIEGSGFIYASEHVLTNAHVVAGTSSLTVQQNGDRLAGRVVVYDPERDLAVIYVPGLTGPILSFAPARAGSGADAIVLGYPLDGPYNAQSARVRDVGLIRGPDIYNANTVTRDIYTIRGLVRSGNSGGPLINPSGKVLGVIFAAAADDQQTGFALSAVEADPVMAAGRHATVGTSTDKCAEG